MFQRTAVADVVVVVAVAATGAREAPGGWWDGLSVPKPPQGVAGVITIDHGHDHDHDHDFRWRSRDWG